jgi:hypothetical protein
MPRFHAVAAKNLPNDWVDGNDRSPLYCVDPEVWVMDAGVLGADQQCSVGMARP